MTEMEILHQIKEKYRSILGENLTGIYIHGSIAFQCFNWNKSDIDFLVVVNQAPSLSAKESLITALLELDAVCPPKGLEMSVVLESACIDFHYPVPFELHFSNAHKERCKTDLHNYCLSMNGTDQDLAAHFTIIRKAGITLYGKDISQVFSSVPRNDYIDSIKGDIENAVTDISEDPIYVILNLCRVLAYIRDGAVLSKEQGGIWGMENLPPNHHNIIENALGCYRGSDIFATDNETEKRFAEYMVRQIFQE